MKSVRAVCRAVALGTAVASLVLVLMNVGSAQLYIILLSIGLFALSLSVS